MQIVMRSFYQMILGVARWHDSARKNTEPFCDLVYLIIKMSGMEREQLKEYRIIHLGGQSAQIEIDRSEVDIWECLADISKNLPVVDMNVKNVPIEEVIQDIYQLA